MLFLLTSRSVSNFFYLIFWCSTGVKHLGTCDPSGLWPLYWLNQVTTIFAVPARFFFLQNPIPLDWTQKLNVKFWSLNVFICTSSMRYTDKMLFPNFFVYFFAYKVFYSALSLRHFSLWFWKIKLNSDIGEWFLFEEIRLNNQVLIVFIMNLLFARISVMFAN